MGGGASISAAAASELLTDQPDACREYWEQQQGEISNAMREALATIVKERPADPLRFLSAEFARLSRDPYQLMISSLTDQSADQLLAALVNDEPKMRAASNEKLPAKTDGLPYYGGAFGDDGKLYLIPRETRRVICFDPMTELWAPIGDELPAEPAYNKWIGAARCSDGCIYALPGSARQALKIDPKARTASLFGDDLAALAPGVDFKWHETVLAGDGCLYGMPAKANSVLKFDPATGTASTFGKLKEERLKYVSGVYCPKDGCIYAPPFQASRCLRIDPLRLTAEYIGDDLSSRDLGQYHGGAVGGDGRIYCMPGGTPSAVLCIDPETRRTSFVGPVQQGRWTIHRAFKVSEPSPL